MSNFNLMISLLSYLVPLFGLTVLFLLRTKSSAREINSSVQDRSVSIIIPARNEETNIKRLLTSLCEIKFKNLEIIVVDDDSSDNTFKIANSFKNVNAIKVDSRPEGWNGKQWACQYGASKASGDYLLFTDADTFHYPDGLIQVISTMEVEKLEVGSQIPYLRSGSFLQKLLSPFFLLLYSSMAPLYKVTKRNNFAIGQYLIFKRSVFESVGGYVSVKDEYVEDIPIVQNMVTQGIKYGVLGGTSYETKMYDTFGDLIKGWRRNFRAGFKATNLIGLLKVLSLMTLLTFYLHVNQTNLILWTYVLVAVLVLIFQRKLGDFSKIGALLHPFGVLVFILVSVLALYDTILKKPLSWKGRNYTTNIKR